MGTTTHHAWIPLAWQHLLLVWSEPWQLAVGSAGGQQTLMVGVRTSKLLTVAWEALAERFCCYPSREIPTQITNSSHQSPEANQVAEGSIAQELCLRRSQGEARASP